MLIVFIISSNTFIVNNMAGEKKKEGKGEMTVQEAGRLGGRKGGERTAETHGREFYEKIGRMGGEKGGHNGGQRVKQLIEEGKEAEETGGKKVFK
jgi:hypothetical protein